MNKSRPAVRPQFPRVSTTDYTDNTDERQIRAAAFPSSAPVSGAGDGVPPSLTFRNPAMSKSKSKRCGQTERHPEFSYPCYPCNPWFLMLYWMTGFVRDLEPGVWSF